MLCALIVSITLSVPLLIAEAGHRPQTVYNHTAVLLKQEYRVTVSGEGYVYLNNHEISCSGFCPSPAGLNKTRFVSNSGAIVIVSGRPLNTKSAETVGLS